MSQPTLSQEQLFSLVANEFYLPPADTTADLQPVKIKQEGGSGAWLILLTLLAFIN